VKAHELEEAMKVRNEEDIRFASMTWSERTQTLKYQERLRLVYKALFVIVGLSCDAGAVMEIVALVVFGILGPLALRYDMI
jgi:hypothetical protein